MAQISINDKQEETQLLREYILMERDKLEDGRKTFKEDKSKFEKFKMQMQAKAQQTDQEIQNMIQANERLMQKINLLKREEASKSSQMSKIEEEIKLHKKNKAFLDEMSESYNQGQKKAKAAKKEMS